MVFGPDVLHTRDAQWDPLTIHVYPGADARFVLHEDDGVTYAYERGEHAQTLIEYFDGARSLVIHPAAGAFEGQHERRAIRVVFHDADEPQAVLLGGSPLPGGEGATSAERIEAAYACDARARQVTVWLPRWPIRQPASVTLVGCKPPSEAAPPQSASPGGGVAELRLDASWPEPGTAVVYAYIEAPLPQGSPVEWQFTPAPGWVGEEVEVPRPAGVSAFRAWRCKATGSQHAPGAPTAVSVTVRPPEGRSFTLSAQSLLASECVATWSLLGPTAGQNDQALSGPEQQLARGLSQTSVVLGGQRWDWKAYSMVSDCFGYVNLAGLMLDREPWEQPQQRWVAYAAAQVWSPDDREAVVELVGEDHLKLWVNGQAVVETSVAPAVEPLRVRVALGAGWNRVPVRCSKETTFEPGGRWWGLYARLLDGRHEIMKDIRFREALPEAEEAAGGGGMAR